MKTTTTTPKAKKAARTTAIVDLTPKSEQQVRGGREATVPAVGEIVVTKTQDCASTGLLR